MKDFWKEHKLAIILFVGFIVAALAFGTIYNGGAVDPAILNQ